MEFVRLRSTPICYVGSVALGGSSPVRVQSMTNTATSDLRSTVEQVRALADAGSELVRFTVKDDEDAQMVASIVEQVKNSHPQCALVGDFHYNGHLLLAKHPEMAKALDKYRINPGNVGFGKAKDSNFLTMIEIALKHDKPIRIGVNGGSLDQKLLQQRIEEDLRRSDPLGADEIFLESMVESAIESAKMAESIGFPKEKIILSCKMSSVRETVTVYQRLAKRGRYLLHLGLTEAGMGIKGIVHSTLALGTLLQGGIGDTIRVSLTPMPQGDRCDEVRICQEILQGLGLRNFLPQVTACPGCGRTTSTTFQELALEVTGYLQKKMPSWRERGFEGVEELKVAVMGCIVNGPGEARGADIGISLPGTGESPRAPVYIDGEKAVTLEGNAQRLASDFLEILESYVEKRFAGQLLSH